VPRFEAHITVDRDHARKVEDIGEVYGWVFSQITGCPILGQGTYCYLTRYEPDAAVLRKEMDFIVTLLRKQNMEPLRAKIERIIYDTKTGVNEFVEQRESSRSDECMDINCYYTAPHGRH
jgi:hypothetical protein